MTASARARPLDAILADLGKPDAFTCGDCGAPSKYPHRCAACGKAAELADKARRIAADAAAVQRTVECAIAALPLHYQWAHFDAPELVKRVRPVKAIATAKAALDENMVVLVGPAGAGKTVLACCIYRAHLERRAATGRISALRGAEPGVVFFDAFALERVRRQSRLGEEPEAILEARLAPVLVPDDLGAEPVSSDRTIAEVLHERHAEEVPTIVTSGLDVEGIAARYGAGIARRLFEGSRVIKLGGK